MGPNCGRTHIVPKESKGRKAKNKKTRTFEFVHVIIIYSLGLHGSKWLKKEMN